jgi:hypothetical protein
VKDIGSKPALYIFHVPASTGSTTNATIPRLLTFQLYADKRINGAPKVPILLSYDECPEVLTEGMLPILRTARDIQIGMMFSHQSAADLKPNILSSVQACSALQITCSARDAATRQLVERSHGEVEHLVKSTTHSRRGGVVFTEGDGERPELRSRVTDWDVNWINNQQRGFLLNTSSAGFTQFNHSTLVWPLGHFLTKELVAKWIEEYGNRQEEGMVLNVDDPSIDLPDDDQEEPEEEVQPKRRPAKKEPQEPPPADAEAKKEEMKALFDAAKEEAARGKI